MSEQPQHLEALAKANKARFARADLKREINRGEVSIEGLLRPGRAILEVYWGMPVCELLAAQRGWGTARTRRQLMRLAINERRTLGALTDRQRRQLIDALAGIGRDERLLAA